MNESEKQTLERIIKIIDKIGYRKDVSEKAYHQLLKVEQSIRNLIYPTIISYGKLRKSLMKICND